MSIFIEVNLQLIPDFSASYKILPNLIMQIFQIALVLKFLCSFR